MDNIFICPSSSSEIIFSCCVIIAIAIVVCAWKLLDWIWFRPKKVEKLLRQQGFNGNSYTLFYGDSKEIMATTKEAKSKPMSFSNRILARATPIYHKAVQKYGEKCFVWLGPRPAVVILDPEMIGEIMSNNYVFHKPPGSPFARLLSRGLASLETHKWAKHRKLINPAFHLHKLKHMVPSFYLSCDDMLREWDEIVANANGGGGGIGSSCEVDVWPYLQTMTSDAISRSAFGSSYLEGRKISQLQKKQAQYIFQVYSSVRIPGYRFLPTKVNRAMKESVRKIESILLGIINKRMEDGSSNNIDLLGILLESNLKEIKQQGNGMSIKEVMEECKIIYFAGQETTASLLVWTMILLSKHKDWQARARDELLQVFGRDHKPHYQGLNHLKIVTAYMYELHLGAS